MNDGGLLHFQTRADMLRFERSRLRGLVDEAKKRFVINVNRESLDTMPGFDKDHWPDLGDLEYATGVYRQWGATPYWT